MCIEEYCGDGIKQIGLGEECDDGNNLPGDGCTPYCELIQ
jgi:cysteine-rich repeat protein